MSNLKLQNITDYASAKAFIGNRDRAKLGHNTYLYRHSSPFASIVGEVETFHVEYHGNKIIIYTPTATFATNCGWHTRTTTNRLNKLTDMSFRIRQGVHQYRKAKSTEWYELSYEGVTDIMVGVV